MPENISGLFCRGTASEDSTIESIDFSDVDTSHVTNMSDLLDGCSSLNSLYLFSFNIEDATDMSNMFRDCSSLTSLRLSRFDTHKVKLNRLDITMDSLKDMMDIILNN